MNVFITCKVFCIKIDGNTKNFYLLDINHYLSEFHTNEVLRASLDGKVPSNMNMFIYKCDENKHQNVTIGDIVQICATINVENITKCNSTEKELSTNPFEDLM
jgi:hypothetical protein